MNGFNTLKLNWEFRKLYNKGKSMVSSALVTYALPNKSGNVRIGITTGKKVGCAVKRNRARRVILAAFRQCRPNLKCGCDVVFVARAKTPYVKSDVIYRSMRQHFIALGYWDESNENTANKAD